VISVEAPDESFQERLSVQRATRRSVFFGKRVLKRKCPEQYGEAITKSVVIVVVEVVVVVLRRRVCGLGSAGSVVD